MRDDAVLERGAVIGRFVVLGLLGKGGMGEVYAAHDPELDRKVAIKLLRADADSESSEGRLRLMREAQAIARVSHPGVIVVYDVGTFGNRVFIAMELVEGSTLRYWALAQHRPWPEVIDVFIAAGRGLAAAHQRGMVHRDFKPDNVMIGADGKVRVMDFGLVQMRTDRPAAAPAASIAPAAPASRSAPATGAGDDDLFATRPVHTPSGEPVVEPGNALAPALTRVGTSMGTPAYMSPEQFRNEATDARSDQFSFCVALYETIYNVRPFVAKNELELADAVTHGRVREAPVGTDVPAWIQHVLLRGLQAEPAQRWPSMNALLAALEKHPEVESRRRFQAAASAKLEGIWDLPGGETSTDRQAREDIRLAFLATDRTYAAKAFDGASQVLDRYVRRWSQLYVESCEATHLRGEQSAEVLDLRMACLEEGLDDLAALVGMFRQATAAVVENAVSAANALGNLERCENIELLRAVVRPPNDAATRERVERLRHDLAQVRALGRVGRVTDGLAAVKPLESEVREIGYGPLLADVLMARCRLYESQGRMDAAGRVGDEAIGIAIACRHDEAAAEIATLQIGYLPPRSAALEFWSILAEALLRRIGGHELLWGWFYNNRGGALGYQGRLEESVADMHRSLAAKEKALEPNHPDIGITLGNLGLRLDEMGRLSEAIGISGRAVAIGEAGFGRDHPNCALLQANYSELLARAGRGAEAVQVATQALATFERETSPDGVLVFITLAALGIAHLAEGKPEPALATLERAERIADKAAPTASHRAQVRFALARALWDSGGDRSRALALATTARREYESEPTIPATVRELALIAAWLAGRSPTVTDAPTTAAAPAATVAG